MGPKENIFGEKKSDKSEAMLLQHILRRQSSLVKAIVLVTIEGNRKRKAKYEMDWVHRGSHRQSL